MGNKHQLSVWRAGVRMVTKRNSRGVIFGSGIVLIGLVIFDPNKITLPTRRCLEWKINLRRLYGGWKLNIVPTAE